MTDLRDPMDYYRRRDPVSEAPDEGKDLVLEVRDDADEQHFCLHGVWWEETGFCMFSVLGRVDISPDDINWWSYMYIPKE